MNVDAMNASPFAFLMNGDFNSGPRNPTFAGLESSPETVMVVEDQWLQDHGLPGVYSVNAPAPTHDPIDHALFKSTLATSVIPVETYYRDWDYRGALSDHLPRLTLYTIP